MKRIIALLIGICCFLTGCSVTDTNEEKIKDLEFTVVESEKVPEELKAIIEKNKESEIKMTYQIGQYLYVIRGYAMQKTGGYSISVNQCFLTEDAIPVETNLLVPDSEKKTANEPSYPVIVLKLQYMDKPVVFD